MRHSRATPRAATPGLGGEAWAIGLMLCGQKWNCGAAASSPTAKWSHRAPGELSCLLASDVGGIPFRPAFLDGSTHYWADDRGSRRAVLCRPMCEGGLPRQYQQVFIGCNSLHGNAIVVTSPISPCSGDWVITECRKSGIVRLRPVPRRTRCRVHHSNPVGLLPSALRRRRRQLPMVPFWLLAVGCSSPI